MLTSSISWRSEFPTPAFLKQFRIVSFLTPIHAVCKKWMASKIEIFGEVVVDESSIINRYFCTILLL